MMNTQNPHTLTAADRARRGMTLVELMVAMAILAIATSGMLLSFMSSTRQVRVMEESFTVANGLRVALADIHSTSLQNYTDPDTLQEYTGLDALIAYYQDPANATFLIGNVDVTGGRIFLYLDERNMPVEVGADAAAGAQVGTFDLNGDGDTNDDNSVAVDSVYPTNLVGVEVQVTWNSAVGLGPVTESRFALYARTE